MRGLPGAKPSFRSAVCFAVMYAASGHHLDRYMFLSPILVTWQPDLRAGWLADTSAKMQFLVLVRGSALRLSCTVAAERPAAAERPPQSRSMYGIVRDSATPGPRIALSRGACDLNRPACVPSTRAEREGRRCCSWNLMCCACNHQGGTSPRGYFHAEALARPRLAAAVGGDPLAAAAATEGGGGGRALPVRRGGAGGWRLI